MNSGEFSTKGFVKVREQQEFAAKSPPNKKAQLVNTSWARLLVAL